MNNPALNEIQDSLQVLSFEDYVAILKRRKTAFIISFASILIIGLLLAFLLPSVYRSEATILIERQEIPADLVETTVTGYVQERIEGISKRMLTRDNLWSIVERHDLYTNRRESDERFDILTDMREGIKVEMLDVRTSEPDQVKQGIATIAFTISFEAEQPSEAQIVTEELATLFIEENKRQRSEHAQEVSNFLITEGDRLDAQITELEIKLAEFKQSQHSSLPELRDLNNQLYEKTDNEIERTKEQIRTLDDRIIALQAELAITKPNQDIVNDTGQTVLTGSERLSLLTAEYLRLSSRYSPQHPDLVKLRREIESLGGESDVSGVTALIEKLTILKDRLSEAKRKYSPDHPDVISLTKAVSAVERGLQTATVSTGRSSAVSSAPDNPRYVSLRTQLDAAVGNAKSERSKLIQLNEKLKEYETRLFQTPVVERDYKLLSRDYENAKNKYHEIRNKQLEARLAIDLESSSKGENFSIVQPAYYPSSPERPNRLGIGLLAFLLAAGCGLGAIVIREYIDHTIYNAKDLELILRAPPLVTVPIINA